jgi:hypothetical protein
MAKIGLPISANATRAAIRGGVSFHTSTLYEPPQYVLSTWQPDAADWDSGTSLWYDPIETRFVDAPRMWRDTSRPFDASGTTSANAYARSHRSTRKTARGAVLQQNQFARIAAIQWSLLGANGRRPWQGYALHIRRDAPSMLINPRTGIARFSTKILLSGWNLFLRSFRESYPALPAPPDRYRPTWDANASAWDNESSRWENAPTTYNEPLMIDFLTNADYESRMTLALADTPGKLDIAVYKASTNWSQPFVPASSLWSTILAQPQLRGTCRIVLSSTFLGTPEDPWNDAAAAALAAAGWNVRRYPVQPILHAKIWNIGNRWAYSGSHNLTVHATTSNKEGGVLTNSPGVITKIDNLFTELWNASS